MRGADPVRRRVHVNLDDQPEADLVSQVGDGFCAEVVGARLGLRSRPSTQLRTVLKLRF
jgi:hypothetical protein